MSEPRLSTAQLQKALGISRRAVTRYVQAGCPHEREGKGPRAPCTFALAEVRAWQHRTARTGEAGRPPEGAEIVRTPTPAPVAKADAEEEGEEDEANLAELTRRVNLGIKRLEKAKRERIEQEARGELVPLEDVRRAWGSQVEVVKTRFRSLPSLLAQRMEGLGYDERHDLLERELRRVLESFAREELAL